jgi:hypothetical protein
MTAIDLDECTDISGGFMWPGPCEPRFPFPPFPPFPDPIGGAPIAITAWFPICALVD